MGHTFLDQGVRGSHCYDYPVPGRRAWISRGSCAVEKTHAACSRVNISTETEQRLTVVIRQGARENLNARGEVRVLLQILLQPITIRWVRFEGDHTSGGSADGGEAERVKSDMRPDVPDDAASCRERL